MRCYCVYIMASRSRVLYTGVTNDIVRRVDEHKRGLILGFTRKYHVTRLVYFERFAEVRAALAREKEIKGWVRARKQVLRTWGKQVLRACGAQDDSAPSLGRMEYKMKRGEVVID